PAGQREHLFGEKSLLRLRTEDALERATRRFAGESDHVAVSLAASERHPDARPGLESREALVHSVGEGLSKRARDHDLGEAWHERDGTREPRFFARGEDAARAPRAPRAA